jgi:hypothetical protein
MYKIVYQNKHYSKDEEIMIENINSAYYTYNLKAKDINIIRCELYKNNLLITKK